MITITTQRSTKNNVQMHFWLPLLRLVLYQFFPQLSLAEDISSPRLLITFIFATKIDLLCRNRNNCDSEISSSKLRASFQIVYSTIYEVVTVLVVLMSIRQVPNNITFLSGTIKILSLLGNKTRVSYRHMSKNIPCVTALH